MSRCINCNTTLTGKQEMFCSTKCANKVHNDDSRKSVEYLAYQKGYQKLYRQIKKLEGKLGEVLGILQGAAA
ncbi:MAG: hypothetical protein KAS32_02570 [Candidatus Peribacteraceae bacterium]|nr:hypothetical protein [Candidatus Peribacteraceae bacterium]